MNHIFSSVLYSVRIFSSVIIHSEEKPHCVLCNKVLSNDSMTSAKHKQHLENVHPQHINKDKTYFERRRRALNSMRLDASKMTFNLQHNSDVTETMKDAQLLTINNLYNLEIAQMIFKYENKQLTQAFNNFFTQKSLKMKTRSNSQIVSNCFRTKVSQQSLKFVEPKLWNKIPSEIRHSHSSNTFTKKLIQHLAVFQISC